MAQPQGAVGLGERLGDVGGIVVAHHPPALDALAVEPGNGTAEKADHSWFLLVRQYLDIGQPRGVNRFAVVAGNDGDMALLVADAIGAPLLAVSGDPVAHLPEPGQGFHVDVDQVSRLLPLVALYRNLWLQFLNRPRPSRLRAPGDGGEGRLQQPGDVPQMQALVPEIHGVLQLLRIERSPER